ncbi:MAG TPA: GTP cyclohydrolase I [Pyrinomonadaceae bacterium]|nr:GTP cyclohydrolase I [Pyrinomonadaceae bacterium]
MSKNPDSKLTDWMSEFLPQAELDKFLKGIEEKPDRITAAYRELFAGYVSKDASEILTVTEEVADRDFSGLVSGLNISYLAFCMHHFLPFWGTVDLIYEPDSLILGIGKLSRLVDYRTRRFNIQENVARELCEDLLTFGNAKGAFARVKASHACLCYRGPQKYESVNVVTYSLGTCQEPVRQQEISIILSN